MLTGALRSLVPAGAAVLLALSFAPETARAQNECGTASGPNPKVTCDPTVGDLGGGITYNASEFGGLTLEVQERMNGGSRTITNSAVTTGNSLTGHGIAIEGTHGQGTLHLIVGGDTNIVSLPAPTSPDPETSRSGIYIKAGSDNDRPVTGSVMVEVGSEVDIGAKGAPLQKNGIRVISQRGGGTTGDSTGGIKITNAGNIYAGERGIRAETYSKKVDGTSGLNAKIEITHSGEIEAGDWGIHAISQESADIAIMVEKGAKVTVSEDSGEGGILARLAAHVRSGGGITITSAGDINANKGNGIQTYSAGGLTGATNINVEAGASVTGKDYGIKAHHHGDRAVVNIDVAGTVTGGTGDDQGAIKITSDDVQPNAATVTVTLKDEFTINGDILFDGRFNAPQFGVPDINKLILNVAKGMTGKVMGNIMDVNDLVKEGAGTAELHGDVTFASSSLEIREGVLDLRNELDLGGGMLTLNVAEDMTGEVMGNVMNVDDLTKSDKGTARLNGDVTFSGDSAEVQDGVLILRGHLDLGGGSLMVADSAKLAVEVGETDGDHGKVTAGTVTVAGEEIFVDYAEGKEQAAQAQVMKGILVFPNGPANLTGMKVTLLNPDGTVEEVTVDAEGKVTGDLGEEFKPPPPTPPMQPVPPTKTETETGGNQGGEGRGGEGRGGEIIAIGGTATVLAVLLSELFTSGFGAMGWSEDEGAWPGTAVHRFSSVPAGDQPEATGMEYQVQLQGSDLPAAGMAAPVSAMSVAMRAHLGGGFQAQLSATPKLAAEAGQDELSGSHYALGLGWRSGVFSTDIGYSHAPLRVQSTFSNVHGLGELSGQYALRHEQMRANAKLDLEAGGVSVSPSVSLFGGTVSQDSYTAASRVWLSEVPRVSQDYAGWKAGLALSPRSEVKAMGLRWRPELRLTTTRLSGGDSGEMQLVQRDRTGALQLQTPARASLPRTVHALSGALKVAGGEDWSLRGGYTALLVDDEFEHAAGAQFRLRF